MKNVGHVPLNVPKIKGCSGITDSPYTVEEADNDADTQVCVEKSTYVIPKRSEES